MLNLAAPTRDSWLPEARAHLDSILLDHAHCEKKAASTAINLIFRYIERGELMKPLSALAREGRGVMLSLHDLGLAARHCTRLILLNGGRLEAGRF